MYSACVRIMIPHYFINFVETRFGQNFSLLFDQNSSGTETHPLTQMLLYMMEQPLGILRVPMWCRVRSLVP